MPVGTGWMNLDYSPVVDDAGHSIGVMAIVNETSERGRPPAQVKRL